MRNLLAYLLLAILLLVGAWFYTCKIRNLCGDTPATTTTIDDEKTDDGIIEPADLKDAYSSIFVAEDNVVFRKSEDTIEKGDSFDDSVAEIAAFLEKNPGTNLTVTGAYADDEFNISDYDEMGLARAHTIKDELAALGIDESRIITESKVNNDMFLDSDLATSDEVIDFKFSENYKLLNDTEVKKAYRSLIDFEELITFYKNDKSVLLLEGHKDAIQNIEFYLNRNKDQKLSIIMPYTDEEDSGDEDQNIGMLRVENLKSQLIAAGIDEDKIVIETEEALDVFNGGDVIKPESIDLNFIFPDMTDEDKIAEMELEQGLESAINGEEEEEPEYVEETVYEDEGNQTSEDEEIGNQQPTMKFRFNDTEMIVNDRIIYYLCDLSAYLIDNPSKKVYITGHTDNWGDDMYNDYLGMERAKNGQHLFKKRCIKLDQIEVESDGEQNPIADNGTAAGRKENRRIEIDIR